jgi:hypothetical protein
MEGARDVWRGAAREKAAGLGAARVAVGWRMDPGSGAACGMAGSGHRADLVPGRRRLRTRWPGLLMRWAGVVALSKCTRPAGNRTGHAADSQHTPG